MVFINLTDETKQTLMREICISTLTQILENVKWMDFACEQNSIIELA